MNYRSGEAPDHLDRSRIARRTLKSVDRNIVPSRFLEQVFASHCIDAGVVPNIIDRERFRFRQREPLAPRLVSTRNFEPLYNLPCTLRAFARVQQLHPSASLTLVGGGSQEPALRKIVDELKLRNVTFTGPVPPDRIAGCYADADIYVQTPNIDNMPSSVLEAYSCGLPVVSTRAGGVPAIVTDGVSGLLAPIDDDEAVAAQVLRLLREPELVRSLTTSAYELTAALTWERVRDQWVAVYRGVLSPTPANAPAVRTI
jgi:glycosyltransferase involved in cell wall biosynthesis